MTEQEIDFRALGFKCGIEIHQQLDTHKLFCNCPSISKDETPDFNIERRMRAVAGEMGDVDPAALHEFLRNRELVYEAYESSNCLVELDEEPPAPLNQQALRICLKVALLLGAKPVDEIHVMRKTVIDGSNTSGFQRTMLVATDGKLPTSRGVIGIPAICLEEDAARIISEKNGVVHYRLDRLGIPLIELATTPDIRDGAHAREVCEKIGSILRATDVKRGLGTIRQDINISIADGERIEVKGVQDLKLIKKVVDAEVQRQMMLVKAKNRLLELGATEKDFDQNPKDLTEIFTETSSSVIKDGLRLDGGVVLGVRLKALDGLLKGMLGPQLAQYARAIAGVKGIFHGDELPAYGVSPKEVEDVKKSLDVNAPDSFAIVCAPHNQAQQAMEAVLRRCRIALAGVPIEVRRAKEEGQTEFMRPLPGSSRMYPETDEPLVQIAQKLIHELGADLPELREDRAKRFQEMGVGHELASQLSIGGRDKLFEALFEKHPGVDATTIATTITSHTKEAVKRYNIDESSLTESHYDQMLALLSDGTIVKDVLVELISKVAEEPDKQVMKIVLENDMVMLVDDDLEKIIAQAIVENKMLIEKMGDKALGPLTGKVMASAKGKADAKKVQEILKKELKI